MNAVSNAFAACNGEDYCSCSPCCIDAFMIHHASKCVVAVPVCHCGGISLHCRSVSTALPFAGQDEIEKVLSGE